MCKKSWQYANSSLESLKLVSSVGGNFLQCSGLDWSSITEFWELFQPLAIWLSWKQMKSAKPLKLR